MREEDAKARLYYLQEAKAQNWSVRQLQRQIETRSYQRLLSTQDTASVSVSPQATPSIRDFIKDPYVLEFLGLPEDPAASETEVESAIISQLQSFLLEMGHGFSFVARQMRVSTETSHFHLDLVFYHRTEDPALRSARPWMARSWRGRGG
jgi:predicted nuclease of restriction endonuclease-like (RecB) superfamily